MCATDAVAAAAAIMTMTICVVLCVEYYRTFVY